MIDEIQKVYSQLGENGCYLLSIIKGCEEYNRKYLDPVMIYKYALKMKWIEEDCYVNYPECITNFLISKNVAVYKSEHYNKDALFNVGVFYNPRTNLYHYVYMFDENNYWDSLGKSVTCREGYIKSYRVFI